MKIFPKTYRIIGFSGLYKTWDIKDATYVKTVLRDEHEANSIYKNLQERPDIEHARLEVLQDKNPFNFLKKDISNDIQETKTWSFNPFLRTHIFNVEEEDGVFEAKLEEGVNYGREDTLIILKSKSPQAFHVDIHNNVLTLTPKESDDSIIEEIYENQDGYILNYQLVDGDLTKGENTFQIKIVYNVKDLEPRYQQAISTREARRLQALAESRSERPIVNTEGIFYHKYYPTENVMYNSMLETDVEEMYSAYNAPYFRYAKFKTWEGVPCVELQYSFDEEGWKPVEFFARKQQGHVDIPETLNHAIARCKFFGLPESGESIYRDITTDEGLRRLQYDETFLEEEILEKCIKVLDVYFDWITKNGQLEELTILKGNYTLKLAPAHYDGLHRYERPKKIYFCYNHRWAISQRSEYQFSVGDSPEKVSERLTKHFMKTGRLTA